MEKKAGYIFKKIFTTILLCVLLLSFKGKTALANPVKLDANIEKYINEIKRHFDKREYDYRTILTGFPLRGCDWEFYHNPAQTFIKNGHRQQDNRPVR